MLPEGKMVLLSVLKMLVEVVVVVVLELRPIFEAVLLLLTLTGLPRCGLDGRHRSERFYHVEVAVSFGGRSADRVSTLSDRSTDRPVAVFFGGGRKSIRIEIHIGIWYTASETEMLGIIYLEGALPNCEV